MIQPLPRPTLRGTHVRLEPLMLEHAGPLLAAATESRATYAVAHVPGDAAAMRAYVELALQSAARGEAWPFATISTRDDRVVGSTRFANPERWSWPAAIPEPLPAGPDAIEIGWTWLAASAQRTAINTEAKLLMLGHAFEGWRVRRVTLKTDARNLRSRGAMERLGLRFEGILRAHLPAWDGGIRDSAMYSLLPAEWPEVRDRLRARLSREEAPDRLPQGTGGY